MGVPAKIDNLEPELDLATISLAQDDQDWKENGISNRTASYFLTSQMTGAGLIFIPYFLAFLGYVGIIILITVAGLFSYGSVLLGLTWAEVFMGKVKDYDLVRDPYPMIAQKSSGRFMQVIITIFIFLQSLLSYAIYAMLVTFIMSNFLNLQIIQDDSDNNMRIWLFLFFLIVTPTTWFDKPSDNYVVSFVGSFSVVGAALALFVCFTFLPSSNWYTILHTNNFDKPYFSAQNLFTSLGIVMSCFSGGATFPTIQQDMQAPRNIITVISSQAIWISTIYVIIGIGGVVVFHGHLKPNLLSTLRAFYALTNYSTKFLVASYCSICMLLMHFTAGISIHCNPALQYLEIFTNIEEGWNWRRCIIRSLAMTVFFLFSLTLPEILPLFSFLGGSVNIFLLVIFPLAFYNSLAKKLSKFTLIFNSITVTLCLVVALAVGYFNAVGIARFMSVPERIQFENSTIIGLSFPVL